MNGTNVPSTETPLALLAAGLNDLTPELKKAAAYVLENPGQVGVSSIREIADAAGVKPNTLVRMARSIGFDGFDDFRQPFRTEIAVGGVNFKERARWLQTLSGGGKLSSLYAGMAESAIANIENTFANTDARALQRAAKAVLKARKVMVLGVGANYMLAENFTYLVDMALDNVTTIPRPGCSALDDLSRASSKDLLIAMTFKPYRTDVVAAVDVALERGVKIVGISDSAASPIVIDSHHGFVVNSDTPQFFPSTVALMALLESLVAFIVAETGDDGIGNIEQFHKQREAFGFYLQDK